MKCILEYVWIDAAGGMRSKTRVVKLDESISCVTSDPGRWEWSFDGSSTGQATGTDSDVLIRPVALYANPFHNNSSMVEAWLVLCDCYNKDGTTPHATNARVQCAQTETACAAEEPLFGIEQEYVLFECPMEIPYQWAGAADPGCGGQGPYYCGVGGDRCFGRKIVDQHLRACLHAGIEICGTNAEVMASQWEFQVGPLPATQVSDQLWMARYILQRITEEHGCCATFHPKPMRTWNGSGGHTNFSTAAMRGSNTESMRGSNTDAMDAIVSACTKLQANHAAHMVVYGEFNDARMTGLHETSSMHECTWGVSDRGRSIRIPRHVANQGYGYLEDRRPAANLDPYIVTERIMRTCLITIAGPGGK
uniref:glutamine synthetase n=1 Tax=viral metagenome TaxID=1070528 RepID=A0A6C0I532_9ZZZZ